MRCVAIRGRLLAGAALAPIDGGTIVVAGDRIERIVPPGVRPPTVDGRIDVGGATVLPGLIDTHCHLTLPGDGRDVDAYLDGVGDEALLEMGAENAGRALRGGVTTVRDLGARGDVAFRLRARSAAGESDAPRILVAGPVLTPTGGHGHRFGIEADTPAELCGAVDRLADAGADVIKVMASGGSTPGTERWSPSFSAATLRAIVVAAHRRRRPVVAHAGCAAAIENSLDAGVDGIEHATFFADAELANGYRPDLVERMAARRVFVGPTLQTAHRIVQDRRLDPAGRRRREQMQADALANAARMHAAGVRMVVGSDAGFLVTGFDELWLGVSLLVEIGMTPRAAIHAATVDAAAAVGCGGAIGVLAPGASADLLIVDGDPLDDRRRLREVVAVYCAGRRIAPAR